MRAPPESLRPTIGAPTFIARSITLQIFDADAEVVEAAGGASDATRVGLSLGAMSERSYHVAGRAAISAVFSGKPRGLARRLGPRQAPGGRMETDGCACRRREVSLLRAPTKM